MGRASFERVVRLGIARGELPADVDMHLVVDLARAPVIYRRVVAQVPVRRVRGHGDRRRRARGVLRVDPDLVRSTVTS